ncbi:MAG: xanthine dehydrogenase molybdopterin binding subunit [Candidatus Melainabacteria bacterium]|nr:MAG: xanthine dehydrogenase molybdopterin binding subunit [Candidatus Melainabacteria bacterium]
MSVVGKDIPHDSAVGHVTGESIYIDDMPFQKNELVVDYVGSPVAYGKIKSVDYSEAEKIPGVVGVYTYKDLGGINLFGPILQDEVLLCEDHCSFIGEPIVVIAAENYQALKLAKKAVKLDIEELKPILTIDEAKAQKAFIDKTYSIKRGDIATAFKNAEHIIEGTLITGGQDHFSLESQAAIVYPGEHNQIVIHSSTQAPSEVQQVAARVLGLQQNQVVCITKRMGGGFGGKETQATHPAVMAGLVALKTKRPARIIYSIDDDMKFTGKRHPFQNDYKVAFDSEGRIQALEAYLYTDGGAANDLSTAVLGRALTHSDNAYFVPNMEVYGYICKTNFPPNTAFRGFGGPQGCILIENIMEEIAAYLDMDGFEVRSKNCYGINDRNITHYGQLVENNTLPKIFDELRETSDYKARLEQVREFNAKSRTHLKGISFTAVKFGISFTNKFLNQANALVNIYLDGTIQVSTGATEMGQGVNTNIQQLVAGEFSIDHKNVIVMATSTEKNNNTSATAASSATDLNGSAAVNACQKLKQTLAECAAGYFSSKEVGIGNYPEKIVFEDGFVFDSRRPQNRLTFPELVVMAYRERRSLGERGHYLTKGIDFDWSVGQGNPFLYYTNGCAVSEVLIDRFTGQMKVERADLLMDVGKPINPGITRGQIVGAYVQGLGWASMEELKYTDKGALLAHSPTTYKIPNIHDVPPVLNVDIIENDANTVNVRGTKAVGEPPFVLGISVWTAVKHALSFVSNDEIPRLNLPATNEQILSRLTHYQSQSKNADPKQGKTKQPKKDRAAALAP